VSTPIVTKPAVLSNRPAVDSAGNRLQEIVLLFACGHQERSYRLNLSGVQKGWKAPTNAQLMREELTISCPIGVRLCQSCSEVTS
jgi:hypothetical protein